MNILEQWNVTVDELSDAILSNGSLRGMVFGYVAEIKLRELLQARTDVTELVKDDDHDRQRKGDLRVVYKGHEFRIESKSLQTKSVKRVASGGFIGQAQVDSSDRRTVRFADGSTLETTLLLPDEFDVLAINCFAFEDKWQWVFVKNSDLPRSTYREYTPVQQSNLLASLVTVTLPVSGAFTTDLFELLDQLISQRA